MSWHARRLWPLYASLPVLAAMIALSVTPLAWNFMGRPAEAYPELFFLLYGVPWALCLVAAGVFVAIGGRAILSWWPFALAACGCLLFPVALVAGIACRLFHLRLPNTFYWMGQVEMVANGLVLAALLLAGLYGVLKKPS